MFNLKMIIPVAKKKIHQFLKENEGEYLISEEKINKWLEENDADLKVKCSIDKGSKKPFIKIVRD